MTDASTGPTAQSGRIIERIDATPPLFFSEKIGRDFGNPTGGWTNEREKATVLDAGRAQHMLDGALAIHAPNCKVVPA